MVERRFAHVLDCGGMRRAWLRGARTSTSTPNPGEAESVAPVVMFVFDREHAALRVYRRSGNENIAFLIAVSIEIG